MQSGCDVVCATPGRLNDFIKRGMFVSINKYLKLESKYNDVLSTSILLLLKVRKHHVLTWGLPSQSAHALMGGGGGGPQPECARAWGLLSQKVSMP